MKVCQTCGEPMQEQDQFCQSCGGVAQAPGDADAGAADQPMPQPVKKPKKGWLIGAIVALVVIVGGVIAGLLTDWFGLATPLHGLISATEKTLKAESMTVRVTGDDEECEIRWKMDRETYQAVAMWSDNGSDYLLSHGKQYRYSSQYPSVSVLHDEDELIDMIDEFLTDDGIDWEALIKEYDLEDDIDADVLDTFLKSLYRDCLCNDEWLEEYLSFEKDGDVYHFEPNIKAIGEDILDRADEAELFSKNAMRSLRSAVDEVADEVEIASLDITVQDGYLSSIRFTLIDHTYEYDYTVEISDVNETDITEQEIEDFIDKVETAIEKDTCPTCGKRLYGDSSCSNCSSSKKCDRCGSTNSVNYSNYAYDDLCWNCYYYLYR